MGTVTGRTRIAGLVGDPVAHSLSPVMHNAAYDRLGLDWVYVAFPAGSAAAAESVFSAARDTGFVGLNVTMPYKRLALDSADVVHEDAAAVGGANTLSVIDGLIHAFNTDGDGLVASLAVDGDVDVRGTRVVVFGTGPTAASTVHALARHGAAEVTVVSRDLARSTALIASLPRPSATVLRASTYEDAGPATVVAHVLVNATSLGMRATDGSPVVREWLQPHHVVLDVVYGTHEPTRLVDDARGEGARAFDGLGMLVEQGALALERWAGLPAGVAPRSLMRAVAEAELRRMRAHG